MKLIFPAIRITQDQDQRVQPEDAVSEEEAKEIATKINEAFTAFSDVAALAILTDGLVQLYRQFGLTPVMTLKAIAEAVTYQSGIKVDLVRANDVSRATRLARIQPIRRRHR